MHAVTTKFVSPVRRELTTWYWRKEITAVEIPTELQLSTLDWSPHPDTAPNLGFISTLKTDPTPWGNRQASSIWEMRESYALRLKRPTRTSDTMPPITYNFRKNHDRPLSNPILNYVRVNRNIVGNRRFWSFSRSVDSPQWNSSSQRWTAPQKDRSPGILRTNIHRRNIFAWRIRDNAIVA